MVLLTLAKKAGEAIHEGVRKRGRPASSKYSSRPKRPRIDSNPIVQFFNRVSVFNEIFNDPTLEYIDPFATIMFFFSSLMLVMCVPYSLLTCPYGVRIRAKLGRFGKFILRVADSGLRAGAVYLSLLYVWIPVNQIVNDYFKFNQPSSKDAYEEYVKDPDNFKPKITNDPTPVILASYIIAGLSMTGALMLFVRCIQTAVADDPEQLKRDMEEAQKQQLQKGSGDMPAMDKEEPETITAKRRKTPVRSCRLRNAFGIDSAK